MAIQPWTEYTGRRQDPVDDAPTERLKDWGIIDAPKAKTHKVPSGYSVMNTVALRRALNKNSSSDIVEAIGHTIQKGVQEAVKDVLLEKVKPSESTGELVDRVIFINVNPHYTSYEMPDGNYISDHPGRLNRFMHDLKEKGGEVISLVAITKETVMLHYRIPESEIIYLDTNQGI